MPELTDSKMSIVMSFTDMQVIREALARTTGQGADEIAAKLNLEGREDFYRNLKFFTRATTGEELT